MIQLEPSNCLVLGNATEVPLVISLSIGLKIHYRLQTKQYKPVDRRFAHPREDGERNLWLAAISLGNLKFVDKIKSELGFQARMAQ
jgi:hypothetical protein